MNIKTDLNIYKVTFLLYQLLIFVILFIIWLFRQRNCKKKKFLPAGSLWLFCISPSQWIGNEQLFKVGPAWILIIACKQKKKTKTIKKHSTVINNFYFFVLNFVLMFVLESRQVGDVQNLVPIFWNFNIIRKIIRIQKLQNFEIERK